MVSTFGKIARTIGCRQTIRATGGAAPATTTADDIAIVIEIMKVSAGGITGSATDPAIVPTVTVGGDTGILAEAVAEKSPAMRRETVPIPSVLHSYDSKTQEILSQGALDGLQIPALVPEVPV